MTMKMQIERWGNSLAVRLPRLLIERFKLKEGDEIVVDVVESALAKADADAERRRDEALKRLTARRRPLPPRFKFDRQEANSR